MALHPHLSKSGRANIHRIETDEDNRPLIESGHEAVNRLHREFPEAKEHKNAKLFAYINYFYYLCSGFEQTFGDEDCFYHRIAERGV